VGFFFKKGFCYIPKKKDLRLTRQNFEKTSAPGAHDALKIGLVERRSWSQKIKKRENVCFS
jgi:hypothetical protein